MESDSVVELSPSVVVDAVVLSVDDAVVDSSDEVELAVVLSSLEDEEEDEVSFELVLEDLLEVVELEVGFDDVVLVDVGLEEVEVVELEVGLADEEDLEEVVLVVLELEVALQRVPMHSVPSSQYDLPLQHSAFSGMQPVPHGAWSSLQLDWRRCKSESKIPSRAFLGYSRISWLS